MTAAVACDDSAGRDGDVREPDAAHTLPDATEGAPDSGPDVEEPGDEVEAPDDLGAPCFFNCIDIGTDVERELCIDEESAACDVLCLVDKRGAEPQGYCSMPCDTACPPGYTCMAVESPEDDVRACVANPAVCGNGIIERGEACDDGNTAGGDTCAPDCSRETLPTTAGRVTLTIDGREPVVFEGETEGGFAHLRSNGALVWNYTSSVEILAFDMPGFAERTSADGLQLVEFHLTPLPCNFSGQTMATLTTFDAAERRLAGHFDLGVACWANCFDCGGDGATRAVTVDFDLVWLDRPDL